MNNLNINTLISSESSKRIALKPNIGTAHEMRVILQNTSLFARPMTAQTIGGQVLGLLKRRHFAEVRCARLCSDRGDAFAHLRFATETRAEWVRVKDLMGRVADLNHVFDL